MLSPALLGLLSPQQSQTPINVALAANGGVATASSNGGAAFLPDHAINGDRTGAVWGVDGGWEAPTFHNFPHWLEAAFSQIHIISKIVVVGVQDNYNSPIEPTLTLTSSDYGLVDYDIEYWDGSDWQLIESVSANNKVMNVFTFPSVSTDKVRVTVNSTQDGKARIVELEAWT